jgi:hypothetical protein
LVCGDASVGGPVRARVRALASKRSGSTAKSRGKSATAAGSPSIASAPLALGLMAGRLDPQAARAPGPLALARDPDAADDLPRPFAFDAPQHTKE